MKTALIIHGHFYQPPRENPNTGIVEEQASAAPYKNWNEAVYQTCYKPNAFSRYLNPRGKILWINNNYEQLSTNFGPTLLKWLDSEHPHFIDKLIEADKKSIATFGHSNFIAQCYNHTILPLDSVEVKRIEIAWALEDYRKRFGHESEGFWCSECAIDKETIDELAKAGIKFVVLSPWQAVAINGIPLNGKPAPCDRPFIIKGKKHSISAFFYDPDLASGISFGHYLTDADKLYKHLVEMKAERDNPELITCATDGEIYGHHEAFGDMALAALLKKVSDGSDFYITNYGSYLANNPATEEATLFNGKEHVGSSWSCCHGVERWYSDCGCHTGGPDTWNQKWRTPLRKAFNNLESKAREIISSKLKEIFNLDVNYEDFVIKYGKVIVHTTDLNGFFTELENTYNKTLSAEEKTSIAVIMDSYKNVLFSFTSCGWFFNDISGIEPRQNITYALNAAKNLQPFTKLDLTKLLLQDLSKACSNIQEEGTGADIAKTCSDRLPGVIEACYFFIKNTLDIHFERFKYSYGIFNLRSISNSLCVVENSKTQEIYRFFYTIDKKDCKTVNVELKNLETGEKFSSIINLEEHEDKISKHDILESITTSFGREIDNNGLNEAKVSILICGLDGLRAEGVEPNLCELQNSIYPYLTGKKKSDLSPTSRTSLIEKLNFSYDLF